ncbi:MAG TPA: hypothetical protein PKZ42_01750 [Syntrophales bacterium]|nr:hypothetical protein [Syntrophales bacterium]
MDFETKLDNLKLTDEDLIKRIQTEYQNAIDFRKPRIVDWHANEDMLYGKKPNTLSKRSNINLWLMHGFVYTFLSKIKNPPSLKFEPTEDADIRKAKKITSLWELDSSPTRENWKFKDLLGKKSGMASGRVIDKIVTEYPYRHRRQRVDHYDFLIDPLAGGISIENARFLGQDNIFKSKSDLENNEDYDQAEVKKLIEAYEEDKEGTETVDNEYKEKSNRFAVIGMTPDKYLSSGEGVYKLLEWYTPINGVRYYIVCNLEKKIILRKCPLEDIFSAYEKDAGNPLYPFDSWAYFPDEFNFWSIAPMDIVRDNFQTRNVVMNQAVDNNEDKNKPSMSYDPDIYKRPELLKRDKAGRIIPTAKGKDPKAGLYIHPTNSIYDPAKLSEILEDVAAKVTGVTPAGQGLESGDQKVGIYYGNQAEVADRMSLFEESYNNFNIGLGVRYLNGLKDKMEEPIAVKMIGEKGAEWDEIMKEELGEFDISITGGLTEARNDEVEKKSKLEYLAANRENQLINPKWLAEQELSLIGFDQVQIKRALAAEEANEDEISEAAQDIQKLLNGDKIRPNPKATTVYMQHILDFYQKTNLTQIQEARFARYLEIVQTVAIRNTVRQAQMDVDAKMMEMLPTLDAEQPQPPENKLNPNTKGATVRRSSNITNDMKQNYAA